MQIITQIKNAAPEMNLAQVMRHVRQGILALLLIGGVYLLWFRRPPDSRPVIPLPAVRGGGTLAIRDAKIYVSPEIAPLERATVLARDGVIAEVGSDVSLPPGSLVLPCERCIVTAGFWNAHVHFVGPNWSSAAGKSTEVLDAQLEDMLTSRGFTTVVDAGSEPSNTVALRRRIESGELRGPHIYTAGLPLHSPKGLSYYLRLPFDVAWLTTKPASPEDAVEMVGDNVAIGADLLKLYTDTFMWGHKGVTMPVAIAKAAVGAAHAQGQLAYAHASNLAGLRVAIDGGVDVLAHGVSTEAVDEALMRDMVGRRMGWVPTLSMFSSIFPRESDSSRGVCANVRAFHEAGGQLLFGTDVGALTDYRTEEELRALEECGLSSLEILRMLTTAPAERFSAAGEKGTVERGKRADLVVLDKDPSGDASAFARVVATVRQGRVLFQRK